MLPILRKTAFYNHGCRIIVGEKTAVGAVIPDLVFCLTNAEGPDKPQSRNLTHLECAILAEILRTKMTSVDHLSRALFAPLCRIAPALTILEKRHLIRVEKSGNLRPYPSRIPKVQIVAIEAKLTRWQEAISQATAYLSFTNSTYIAMPMKIARDNGSIRQLCARAGIGLIAVEENKLTFLIRPKSQANISAKWLWVADKLSNFSSLPK